MALIHGGQLQQVVEKYKIPERDWLDVSTGIAPLSYPIPDIPHTIWQQLPQQSLSLLKTAKTYYQASDLLITNGSQAIIKALPKLFQQSCPEAKHVHLPERGYKEHAHAWQLAGYQLHFYQDCLPPLTSLQANSVLVIINPNNPTGSFFHQDTLQRYHEKLTELNGLLIIDEAFIDVMPEQSSYCPHVSNRHCIVLRSFGKFFGLAGIRIGFLIANLEWCDVFKEQLGPWQVNGPAQVIAEAALRDEKWQITQKTALSKLRKKQEIMLEQVFSSSLLSSINGCDLFLTLSFHQQNSTKTLYHLLCQQGIYCRLSDEQDTLRFGIVEQGKLARLESACEYVKSHILNIKNFNTLMLNPVTSGL